MKKILFLSIICACIIHSASGQNFLSENKLYTMAYDMQTTGFGPQGFYWKFMGDTLLNGITYKKSYKSSNADKSSWALNSIWREEAGKVYMYNTNIYINDGKDILTYDFNLGVRDTFNYLGRYQLVVDSVKIAEWGTLLRKHFYFHAVVGQEVLYNYLDVWVEGIGNIEYPCLPSQLMLTGGYDFLVCYEESGVPVYHNPAYTSCFITSANELETKQIFSVYQTHEGDLCLTSVGHPTSTGKFTLFTSEGKTVETIRIESDNTRLCPPGTGLWLYRFESSDGKVQTGKVVVK